MEEKISGQNIILADLRKCSFSKDCRNSKLVWARHLVHLNEIGSGPKSISGVVGKWTDAYRFLILGEEFEDSDSMNDDVAMDILYTPMVEIMPFISFNRDVNFPAQRSAIVRDLMGRGGREISFMPVIGECQDSGKSIRIRFPDLRAHYFDNGKFVAV